MATHNDLGKKGEALASQFLEAKGYTIFDQNYNYKKSELDIIAFKEYQLHFVEVKTRKNTQFNGPEEAVSEAKIKEMAKAAAFYQWERQLMTVPAVFDVVAVSMDDPENPVFQHFENIAPPDMKFPGF